MEFVCCVVAVECPAAFVGEDVVVAAEGDEVVEVGGALRVAEEVVDVAVVERLVAAGEDAAGVVRRSACRWARLGR